MVLGFDRKNLALGPLAHSKRIAAVAVAGFLALAATAQTSEAATVGACTGVSLPRSVVTDITGDVLTPVIGDLETLLNTLTFGTIDLGLSSALTSAAAGAPITLQVLDVDGNTVDVLSDPTCDVQADAYELESDKGISLGGNRITGLGTTGLEADAGETNAIAIGDNASTAVGAGAAIALGENASSTHSGSVALGAGSIADGTTLGTSSYIVGGAATAEVNIGDRRITGLAAGANDTDAVNIAQLKAAQTDLTGIFGSGAAVNSDGTLAAPTYTIHDAGSATSTTDYNDVGSALAALDDGVVNLLSGTAGLVQQVGGTPGTGQITVGAATGGTSVNLAGTGGDRTLTGVADGVADNDAVNVGQLNALADNAVQYDDASKGAVTLGGASGTAVTNLAAGAINATSTDAINGSQLYGNALSIAGALGGGSAVNADGTLTAPTYTIHDAGSTSSTTDYNDVGSALAALDDAVLGNTTAIDTLITNINLGGIGLVQQLGSTAPITVGKDTGGGAVNFAGTSGDRTLTGIANGVADNDAVNVGQLNALADNAVQYDDASKGAVTLGGAGGTTVTNLAAGAVNATSTDAINGSQLYTVQQQVDQNTTGIANLDNRVLNIEGSITSINTQITTLMGAPAGLVQQTGGSPGSGEITIGAATGGDTVNIAGTDGDRRLTGLAEGDVSAGSNDAVTGSQLYAAQQQLTQTTTVVNNLQNGADGYIQVNNTAVAPKPSASGANTVAAGAGAVASGNNSAAFGTRAHASADNSVALGNGSVAAVANTVSVARSGLSPMSQTVSATPMPLTWAK